MGKILTRTPNQPTYGATGGAVTYVVAAADSTYQERARANSVCPGAADDVTINAIATTLRALWGGTAGVYPTLYFCQGTYNCTAKLDLTGLNVIMDGLASFPITHHGAAIEVGYVGTVYATSTLTNATLKLAVARAAVTDATTGDYGIALYNCKNCDISIVRSTYFYDGVLMSGHGQGFSANTVRLGSIQYHARYGVILTDEDHEYESVNYAGWANENIFYGGHFTGTSGTGHICITSDGSTKRTQNNNVFHKPTFEGSYTYGFDFLYARYNHAYNVRFEGPTYVAHFGTSAAHTYFNVVQVGYGAATILNEAGENHAVVAYRDVPMIPIAMLDFSRAFVDSDGNTRVPGAEIRKSTDSVSYAVATNITVKEYTNTAFTGGLGGTYISIGTGRAVGIMVDTSSIKRFQVRQQFYASAATLGRPLVICYDTDGTIVYGTDPYYVTTNSITTTTYYGNGYTQGSDLNEGFDLTFHTDTKSAFIGWTKGTNEAALTGLNIYVSSSDSYASDSCRTWLKYSGLKEVFPNRYSAGAPTQGGYNCLLWEQGDIVWHSDAAAGEPMGWMVIFTLRTTLDGDEAAGQTVLSVTSNTGVEDEDLVGIMLDSGAMQWTHVNSHVDGDTITVHTALTGAAASGNAVVFVRFTELPDTQVPGSNDIRHVSGTLSAGASGAMGFYWHNPEKNDILIKQVMIDTTTASTDTGAVMNVGIADDSAGTNAGTEFFSSLPTDATGISVSNDIVLCQDSTSSTDSYVVGIYATDDSTAIAGSYHIEYVGR